MQPDECRKMSVLPRRAHGKLVATALRIPTERGTTVRWEQSYYRISGAPRELVARPSLRPPQTSRDSRPKAPGTWLRVLSGCPFIARPFADDIDCLRVEHAHYQVRCFRQVPYGNLDDVHARLGHGKLSGGRGTRFGFRNVRSERGRDGRRHIPNRMF